MLRSCIATPRQCGSARLAVPSRGVRRHLSRALVVRADSNGTAPQNVLEARAWIDGWKFKQLKVGSLEEGIAKAADYLESTKTIRQIKKAAEEAMMRRTVKVSFNMKKAVKYGCSLKLVGSATEMGAWTPKNAPSMNWHEGDVWGVDMNLKAGSYEFKVVTYADSGEAEWEQGDNRIVKVPLAAEDGTSMSVELKVLEPEKPKEVAAKK